METLDNSTTQLEAAIARMRAAVLIKLAHDRALWCDPATVREATRFRSDEDIWASILKQNGGWVGNARRNWMRLWRL